MALQRIENLERACQDKEAEYLATVTALRNQLIALRKQCSSIEIAVALLLGHLHEVITRWGGPEEPC